MTRATCLAYPSKHFGPLSSRRRWSSVASVCVIAAFFVPVSLAAPPQSNSPQRENEPDRNAPPSDVFAPRPADEVRADVLRWAAHRGTKDQKTLSRINELFAGGSGSISPRESFERVIQALCLVDPEARRFIDACSPLTPAKSLPVAAFSEQDESDEFRSAHLRLYYARALTQRSMYDEALRIFAHINPTHVVDPATCLFYQAVCQHQLVMKKEGLETLDKLLHKTEGVAESYSRVAALMQDELQALDEQSLGGISRKMKDSERRLDLGRGGPRIQKVQAEIIESLDEIIKKAEQQSNPQSADQQGENNSNRSNSPAEDSTIKGATAPGNVDKKNLKKQGSWGNLPDKEAALRAQNLLNQEFPSNYRQAVEEYFKKLAKRPPAK